MRPSLIDNLKQKDVEAVLSKYTLTQFYFPTLFPFKFTRKLKWELLEGIAGSPVAADVIQWDSTSPRKRREIVSKLNGDIKKISIAREKTESQMNEYNELKNYADENSQMALLEWIWEDQEFCVTGVNARLEWLSLRGASMGKISLTSSNNEGIVTEEAVDFLIPTANKSGVTVNITVANAATSKPISKIKAITKAAKAEGVRLKYIFTEPDMVDSILASAETTAFVAPIVAQALNLTQEITLEMLNRALTQKGLPIIGIVDSYVTLENKKGERTQVEPWETGVMLFSETPVLGATYHAPLADESVDSTTSIKAKRNHILVKRFANEEPLVEVCLAMANAFPVLSDAKKKYLVDGLNSTWSK